MDFLEHSERLRLPEAESIAPPDISIGNIAVAETIEIAAEDLPKVSLKYEPARTTPKFRDRDNGIPKRGSFTPRFGTDMSLPGRFEIDR